MEAVANTVSFVRYGRHKIEKLVIKNFTLDDRYLADFTLGHTQHQYGGIDESFS